jgi:adenine deaminase
MKGGTTTIISEFCNAVFPLGYQGIIQFLKSTENQPIKVFVTIPPMVTLSRAAEEQAITVTELRKLLKRKGVIGLGEPYWAPIVAGNKRVSKLMVETMNMGKIIDGHSSGAKDNKLQAYITSGISSCHEPITVEEVKERLRLGLFVLVREGEIRRELEAISNIKDENIDLNRLVLSTDGIGPWQLTADGYMEYVVQKAIYLGFNPITAIKMATINPAQHYGLDNFIGGIAPGKIADVVIVPDLHSIRAEYVISNGQLVARDDQLLLEPKNYGYPKWMERSIRLTRDFTADDFTIPVAASRQQVRARVIDLVTGLVTREAIIDIPVSKGLLCIDVATDLLKIAAIARTYEPGKTFVGFIRGFKLKKGAIATSASWDLSDIIVVGADEADMAQAVNRIRQLNGGIVLCTGGKIQAELPLPIGGMISEEPMETIARKLQDIQQLAANLGFPYPDLRITLAIMTTPAIPFLRICEDGLFSIDQNSFVDLIVD